MKSIYFLIAAVSFCLGSADVAAQDSVMTEKQEKNSKAIVYVYRAMSAEDGRQARQEVYSDGKSLAKLGGGEYLIALLAPGKHSLKAEGKDQSDLILELKAGETYYFRLASGGTAPATPLLAQVPREKATVEIRQAAPIKAAR